MPVWILKNGTRHWIFLRSKYPIQDSESIKNIIIDLLYFITITITGIQANIGMLLQQKHKSQLLE